MPHWFVTTGSTQDALAVCVRRSSLSRFPGVLHWPGVVTLWPRRRRPFRSSTLLKDAFGLTDAESRFAGALFNSLNLSDAAQSTGITDSTARSYLKRIFMKTGTRRQPELVSLLSAISIAAGFKD